MNNENFDDAQVETIRTSGFFYMHFSLFEFPKGFSQRQRFSKTVRKFSLTRRIFSGG